MSHTTIAEHMRTTLVPSAETCAAAEALLRAGQRRVYSVASISSDTNPDPSMLWMGDEVVRDFGVVASHGPDDDPTEGKHRSARNVAFDEAAKLASETNGAAWFVHELHDGAPGWAAFIV